MARVPDGGRHLRVERLGLGGLDRQLALHNAITFHGAG
jgi:hypothetical protein